MSDYFVESAGGPKTKSLTDFSPKRALLIDYNKGRFANHTINDFHYDKISGKEKAVRCNCGKNHLLNSEKKTTDWGSDLSKKEVRILINNL